MGNFYTNISFKTTDRQGILDYLNQNGRRAFVSPVDNGFICVFDEICDTQEIREITKLGRALSEILMCPAISVLNHDDDVFWYQVYQNGKVLDEYNSAPGYFSGSKQPPQMGDTELLCEIFGLKNKHKLTKILGSRDLFASSTHDALARLLGLPRFSIGLGFNYIMRGELRDFISDFEDYPEDEFEEFGDGVEEFGFIETPTTDSVQLKIPQPGKSRAAVEPAQPGDPEVLLWPAYSERVEPNDENDIGAYLNGGTRKLIAGDFNGAILEFNRVLELKSSFPEGYYALYNRALSKARSKDTKGAIEDLLASLKLKSDCEKTKALLTKLLTAPS